MMLLSAFLILIFLATVVPSFPMTISPLSAHLSGKMILAPLTRGGNLPFRRLCADFGMEVSMSEMVYARSLLKGEGLEQARMRRAHNEAFFGVQIATKQIEEGMKAMELASESGANFVDLNCGCPIYEATRRGLGSALLRQPKKLERLVRGMVSEDKSGIPLSVKIRLGCEDSTINVLEVVERLRSAGAAAVTIHGRTAQQRYTREADWGIIKEVVNDGIDSGVPIIGNGDILTHFEAQRRMKESGVDAVMVGRGALIKPWIFQEFKEGRVWEPDMNERIAVYRKLSCYMKEHFGDDELGRRKSWNFLPWHFDFFVRYRPFPESEYAKLSLEQPLISNRDISSKDDHASPLSLLMHHQSPDAYNLVAAALWDSESDADAVSKLSVLAESHEFRNIQANSNNADGSSSHETTELSNIPSMVRQGRRARKKKPQRTPEEIIAIRAERAAKKAALEKAALEKSKS